MISELWKIFSHRERMRRTVQRIKSQCAKSRCPQINMPEIRDHVLSARRDPITALCPGQTQKRLFHCSPDAHAKMAPPPHSPCIFGSAQDFLTCLRGPSASHFARKNHQTSATPRSHQLRASVLLAFAGCHTIPLRCSSSGRPITMERSDQGCVYGNLTTPVHHHLEPPGIFHVRHSVHFPYQEIGPDMTATFSTDSGRCTFEREPSSSQHPCSRATYAVVARPHRLLGKWSRRQRRKRVLHTWSSNLVSLDVGVVENANPAMGPARDLINALALPGTVEEIAISERKQHIVPLRTATPPLGLQV